MFKSRTDVPSSSDQPVSRTAGSRMSCGPSGTLHGSPRLTSVAMETDVKIYNLVEKRTAASVTTKTTLSHAVSLVQLERHHL